MTMESLPSILFKVEKVNPILDPGVVWVEDVGLRYTVKEETAP